MNKYASGYTAMGLISVVGWLVIAVSLIGGIAMAGTMPRGMGYIGFIVAIAGAVQGLLLLGVGALGLAILDGSIAQQEIITRKEVAAPPSERDDLIQYLISASIGLPGGVFLENYKGNLIVRGVDGKIIVGKDIFNSVAAAKKRIDSSEIEAITAEIEAAATEAPENITYDQDGSLIFKDYKIPRRGKEFLINGKVFTSPQEVVKHVLGEATWALAKYKI
jgi:hypothetical protein